MQTHASRYATAHQQNTTMYPAGLPSNPQNENDAPLFAATVHIIQDA